MSLLQKKISKLKNLTDVEVKDISNNCVKSYADIFKSSKRYADTFNDCNQEIITVVLPNSIEYIEVLIACILTGNIFNPIPFFTSDEELERILSYIKPKIVVTNRNLLLNHSTKINVIDPKTVIEKDVDVDFSYKLSILGNETAALYYSSGTTGNPKGVLYSHDNIFYLISSINKGFLFDWKTKHLAILPFGHTAAINYNIFPCLFNGSPLVLAESFTNIAPKFFKIINDEKINYVQVVPTVVYMLLKIRYSIDELNFSSLMFLGCGSSILPLESQAQFEDRFGVKIANLYGLSETGPTHVDDPRLENWVPGTIGLALDVNECKLSENSELLIKGRNVFTGYYKNQNLYDEVVKDGWFHTGDLVSYENGRYMFKDRSKDLIIKGGINIVPAEIEEILYMHESIHEAAVVGITHEVFGEEITAAVVLKSAQNDQNIIKPELYRLLEKHLSPYKHPVDILFFETLPKTHSGKLKRREVKWIVEQK